MIARMKTYWRVFWRFRLIHFMRLLEYRSDFAFWSFVSLMWTVFNFFFFDVIISVSNSLGGWNRAELYVLMSVFTLLDAFTWSFFYHNMRYYSLYVHNGELNQVLLRPIDTQFLLMTQHNTYNNISRFIIGLGMLMWSLRQLAFVPSVWSIVLFIIIFLLALLLLYSLWFLTSTVSFYVEKLDNINEIFPTFRRAWQVPRSVYTGVLSLVFTVIFPIGLITSVPTEILLAKSSPWWVVYFAVISIGLFLLSRWFFSFSLKQYVGQGN